MTTRNGECSMWIYLIRHGETDWNVLGRLQGRTDIPLNENGEKQLEHTGQVLAELGIRPDVMVTSPLMRTRKSASLIAEKVGYPKEAIGVDDRFLEISFGEGEGLTWQEMQEKYPDGFAPGGETSKQVCARAGAALQEYIEKCSGDILVIVSHGGAIKGMIEVATRGRVSYHDKRISVGNGTIFRLDWTEEGLKELACYNYERNWFEVVEQ